VNGGETLNSMRQAIHFQELGFNVETMIYQKLAVASKGSVYLYEQAFEYMFLLSKGKMRTCNLIIDKKNKYAGCSTRPHKTLKNGDRLDEGLRIIPEMSKRTNVWTYGGGDKEFIDHPAPFPEALACDHILSWSNPSDLVLDPMCGSGTTGKMAVLTGRRFVGIDISAEYVELSRERIAKVLQQPRLFSPTELAPTTPTPTQLPLMDRAKT